MPRVLVTGMSGTGKSTVLAELAIRGHITVDTDHDGWTDGDGGPWGEPRMGALLASMPHLIVSGTAENQGRFYDRFEHVVLLSAPIDVLLERVRHRTNPYGRTLEQQQEIRAYTEEVEPLLRAGASVELDATLTVQRLADLIESVLGVQSPAPAWLPLPESDSTR